MKVLVDASPLYPASASLGPTGVGRWTVGAISALARLHPEVEVTFVHFSLKAEPIDVSWMGPNVNMHVIRRPAKLYRALRGTRLLPPIDRTMGAHDVMLGAGYVPWRGRHTAEVPVVYDLSFMLYPETVSRKHLYFLKWRLRVAIQNAPLVVTISEAIRDEIVHHFGLSRERVHVVPPGCDLERFGNPDTQRLEGLPQRYFLFVGTLEPRKNLPALLTAYRILRKEQDDVPSLVIAGGTGWRVSELIRDLGSDELAGHVHTLGYVADGDLPSLYAQAEGLVMPSHYEGFGIPPLEAMAAGCPTITSGRGGLAEVVGDASLMIDPDDPRSISASMQRLLSEPHLGEDLAARGRERAKLFTWESSGQRLREALEAAVA